MGTIQEYDVRSREGLEDGIRLCSTNAPGVVQLQDLVGARTPLLTCPRLHCGGGISPRRVSYRNSELYYTHIPILQVT